MCLWQRYPHGFAVLIGIAILITPKRGLIGLGAFASFTQQELEYFILALNKNGGMDQHPVQIKLIA